MESSQSIRLRIITPEKVIYNEMVNHVVLPAVEGEMGVFHAHVPFMSYLKPGLLKIHFEDQKVIHFTINSGLLEFKDDSLTILTTGGISVPDCDIDVPHPNNNVPSHNNTTEGVPVPPNHNGAPVYNDDVPPHHNEEQHQET